MARNIITNDCRLTFADNAGTPTTLGPIAVHLSDAALSSLNAARKEKLVLKAAGVVTSVRDGDSIEPELSITFPLMKGDMAAAATTAFNWLNESDPYDSLTSFESDWDGLIYKVTLTWVDKDGTTVLEQAELAKCFTRNFDISPNGAMVGLPATIVCTGGVTFS